MHYVKCIKGESRLNPSRDMTITAKPEVYQRGITIESQLSELIREKYPSVSKGNHD